MGKSAVKVFIRTRPTSASSDHVWVNDDGKSVVVKLRKVDDGTVNNQLERLSFKFEHILHGASQEQVFLQTAQEICDNSLMGYNGTVFAYGQTGSGKTYSMMGDTTSYDQRGVIPRALHYLFQEIEMREDREVTVRVSYLEIYNEELYDLLAENPGTADNLVIVEQNRSTVVKGLYQKPVANEEEALASFFEGESGRSVASHKLNSNSSRSHVVFTVFLQTRSGADERVMSSKINFVDLAGSERTKKTNVDGQALKEAMYINKSLTFLEQTVHALSRKDAHIPFRQSKLTAVLKDSLGGNCKTVMIGNVWCEDQHIEECVSTLRFASRVKTLVTDFSINTSNDPTLLMRKYERQINDLKQELAMRNTLAGRARVSYEPMGDLEKMQLSESVKGFLKGDVPLDGMPIESLQQVKEMFNQFKGLHEALEVAIATQSSKAAPDGDSPEGVAAEGVAKSEAGHAEVGDLGDTTSFSVGLAPAHLRPEADGANLGAPQEETLDATYDNGSPSPKKQTKQDSSGFQDFKRSTAGGRDLSSIFNSQTLALKDLKRKIRALGTTVNDNKKQIGKLSAEKTRLKSDQGGALSAEEEQMAQTIKEQKAAYRSTFAELNSLREEVVPLEANLAQTRQRLVDGFNMWFRDKEGTAPPAVGEAGGEGDDEEEMFERMNREIIITKDPESIAFHGAKKSMKPKNQGSFTLGDKGRANLNRKLEATQAR